MINERDWMEQACRLTCAEEQICVDFLPAAQSGTECLAEAPAQVTTFAEVKVTLNDLTGDSE